MHAIKLMKDVHFWCYYSGIFHRYFRKKILALKSLCRENAAAEELSFYYNAKMYYQTARLARRENPGI